MQSFRPLLPATLLLIALTASSQAQSVPTLRNTLPIVLERGQSIDLTLSGQHIAKVDDILIVEPRGLEAKIIHPTTQPTTQPIPANDKDIHLTLTAAADAALGERELRLSSPNGISAPLRVVVSQYPSIVEKEPNNTPQLAQEMQLPAVLTGRIDVPGDVDCFRFAAGKDTNVIFDVHAVRSASKLDPVLVIHDASGRELPAKIDIHNGDPTLIFTAPADGTYEMEIRDLEFRGGEDFVYRVDAGAIPYVQALAPMTAQPGSLAQIHPLGFNLQGLDRLSLDLSYSAVGPISLRGQASMGLTNPLPFEITDFPAYAQKGANHSPKEAEAVPFPIDISGHVDQSGDEDFFKFHLPRKQLVSLQAIGRKMGSEIDPLLTLRNVKGDPIATNDDNADARITRELEAGDYFVSVRDLTYHGGPAYAYRLRIAPGAASSAQDFAVRFTPDAIRISQGGTAAVFCDVQRMGGFKGDVTLTIEGLPPGVNVPPVVLLANSSDIFTISAAPTTATGTYPIQVRASGMVDNRIVTKLAEAQLDGRPVQQAYLTIVNPAPFTIEVLTTLAPSRVQQLNNAANGLAARLAGPNPQLEAAQAAWEKRIAMPLVWTVLDDAKIASAAGTEFTHLPDGSFLATGKTPDKDTYTITATSHQNNITAVRLEVLPDDSLPQKGPGRQPGDGNFVLSKFAATYAPEDEPTKIAALPLKSPRALFEQAGYPIIDALEPKPEKGWANSPNQGKRNAAYFFLPAAIAVPSTPPTAGHPGTAFTFTLDQQFNSHFLIGRLRLSVTSDPEAMVKATLPANVVDAAMVKAGARSDTQKARLASYYRSIDPQYSAMSNRLMVLRNAVGPAAELARIEAALSAQAPQLAAEQAAWEKRALAGSVWLPLEIADSKSQAGATIAKQADGSLLVTGTSAPTDVYTLSATAPIRNITAIRIEALPDARLPGGGPGRGDNGNFVLTKLALSTAAPTPPMTAVPVEFRGATASFQQPGFSPLSALDDRDDTGWAVLPNVGLPSQATFYAKEAFATDAGARLTLVLEHKFAGAAKHTLGRFRAWVTSNANPDDATMLPAQILAAMRIPADKRDAAQRTALADYYKISQAPSITPLRSRADELKSDLAEAATFVRNRPGSLPLVIDRNGFDGDVQITIEGFTTGKKRTIAQELRFTPMAIKDGAQAGAFTFTVEPGAELGTRLAVLKAEAKINGETYVQYSPAFPLTVTPAR